MHARIAGLDLSPPDGLGYRFFSAACVGICNVSDRLLNVSKSFVDGLPHTSNHLKTPRARTSVKREHKRCGNGTARDNALAHRLRLTFPRTAPRLCGRRCKQAVKEGRRLGNVAEHHNLSGQLCGLRGLTSSRTLLDVVR